MATNRLHQFPIRYCCARTAHNALFYIIYDFRIALCGLCIFLFTTCLPSELPEDSEYSGAAGLVLASINIYMASFALGLGKVPSMQSGLYPLAVRSLGSGVATAMDWTGNLVMGLIFVPLTDVLSPSWTFVLYAGVCTAGYYSIIRICPETAGLSLEEATALLNHGWAVRQ